MSRDFGLYVILTQPRAGHIAVAEACVRLGVRMMQLREKHLADRELLRLARELRTVTRGTDTALFINDRPDIAALCDADGLHLGQDDMSLGEARRIVGDDMRIGLSTHSLEQASAALAQQPDYIGFGPLWSTPTKANPDPIVGTGLLSQVLAIADVPVVAIGGIFPERIPEVLAAGARNLALVRHFMDTDDPAPRIAEVMAMLAGQRSKT
ncbi:MAG: thiamine phosphate synthase [Candidatus Cloacimonetes bacterium]|nr:thiamine phosphate synthase [Candidatus Cloacimonadota bacterium]